MDKNITLPSVLETIELLRSHLKCCGYGEGAESIIDDLVLQVLEVVNVLNNKNSFK